MPCSRAVTPSGTPTLVQFACARPRRFLLFRQVTRAAVQPQGSDAGIRAQVTKRIKTLGESKRPREAVSELAQMARLGVQPDTQAGTALLNACVRNGQIDMAQAVFDELFGNFLQPDDITFSILLKGFGSCAPPRWVAISSLLSTMEQKYKLQPSTAVYNCLLEICARTNDEERGFDIIDRMSKASVPPNKYTLEAVKRRKSLRSYLKRSNF